MIQICYFIVVLCQHLRHISVSSVSRWGRTSRPPAASSTARAHWPSLCENQSEASSVAISTPPADLTVMRSCSAWLTSVYLQTGDRCWVASSSPPGSSSSSLSPSVSSPPCGPRPARQDRRCLIHFNLVLLRLLHGDIIITYVSSSRTLLIQTFCWIPPYWCVLLVRTFFFLASSSCFFLCSSCSLLSFSSWRGMKERVALHFYASTLLWRLTAAPYWLKRLSLTARRVCLSFSLSARILCCSALSVRRFSCTGTTLSITSYLALKAV